MPYCSSNLTRTSNAFQFGTGILACSSNYHLFLLGNHFRKSLWFTWISVSFHLMFSLINKVQQKQQQKNNIRNCIIHFLLFVCGMMNIPHFLSTFSIQFLLLTEFVVAMNFSSNYGWWYLCSFRMKFLQKKIIWIHIFTGSVPLLDILEICFITDISRLMAETRISPPPGHKCRHFTCKKCFPI